MGLDTTYFSNYYTSLFASGSFNEFVYQYLDKNKKVILQQYTLPKFVQSFNVDALTAQFIDYAERKGVKKDLKGYKISEVLIKNHLKALIARVIWQNEGFFTVNSMLDNTLKTAIR